MSSLHLTLLPNWCQHILILSSLSTSWVSVRKQSWGPYQHMGSSTGYVGCTKKGTIAEQDHGRLQHLQVPFSWLPLTLMFLVTRLATFLGFLFLKLLEMGKEVSVQQQWSELFARDPWERISRNNPICIIKDSGLCSPRVPTLLTSWFLSIWD